MLAARRAPEIGFSRDAPAVLRRRTPALANDRARRDLDWHPRHSIDTAAAAVAADGNPLGALARHVGAKGYHDAPTGIYTR